MTKFHYLKAALAVILGFVGIKMLLAGIYIIPVAVSLGIIAGVLTLAIIASLVRARRLGESANDALEQTAPAS